MKDDSTGTEAVAVGGHALFLSLLDFLIEKKVIERSEKKEIFENAIYKLEQGLIQVPGDPVTIEAKQSLERQLGFIKE